MRYEPITAEKKESWIKWLEGQVEILSGRAETPDNKIFSTPEGDIATAKDLVGNLLATLSNQTIEIK